MFLDQVAGEVQQEEVKGLESTQMQMAGPTPKCRIMAGPMPKHRLILLASSQAMNPPGMLNKMHTQLPWQGLLQMWREQGVLEWQQQWQGCGQGDRREEQEQVDRVDQLGQVKEETRGRLVVQAVRQPMRLRVVPLRFPVTVR